MLSLTLLPANEGDCLWLEYGGARKRRVLIDCGRKSTYRTLSKRIDELPADERSFELLVISHIDRDHIEGALELMADEELDVSFRDIWFNGYKHLEQATGESFGVVQGEALTAYLSQPDVPWNEWFARGPVLWQEGEPLPEVTLAGGLKLTLLSPTLPKLAKLGREWLEVCKKEGLVPGHPPEPEPPGEERFGPPDVERLAREEWPIDTAEANGSSIAFVAEYEGKRVLFAADAHPDVLERALRHLTGDASAVHFDAVKVSHHGSAHNTTRELLELIECDTWLFSTNGSYFHHPSDVAVAKIIKHGNAGGRRKRLVFNYRSDESEVWNTASLKKKWGYATVYPPAATPGLLTLPL